MYKVVILLKQIAVDYYLGVDVRKAKYFQDKLNVLAVKSLNAISVQKTKPKKVNLQKKIKNQIDKFKEQEKVLMKSIVEKS